MKFMQCFDFIYLFAESGLGDCSICRQARSEVQLFGQDNDGRAGDRTSNPGEHFSSSLPHRQRLVNAPTSSQGTGQVREKYQKKKIYFLQSAEKKALDKENA